MFYKKRNSEIGTRNFKTVSYYKRVFLLLCGIILFSIGNLNAGKLFEEGTSKWEIVVPETADATEHYASVELQTAIKKMSGVSLPITKRGNLQGPNLIILGTPKNNLAVKKQLKKLKLSLANSQKIAIYTINGNLYLAGESPRAVLYAVYTFLQDAMKVQWLWPGNDGEFIPKHTSFELPELAINKTPGFKYRGFHLCFQHANDKFETWMTRNFVNIMRSNPEHKLSDRRKKGLYIMFSSHNVKLSKNIFKVHPEYFALVNGKRVPWQLCLSNPVVEKKIIEKFKKLLNNSPDIDILSIFPSDNKQYCQCEKCTSVSTSTRWFDFFKKICATLKLDYPNLKFASIAYQGYKALPETDLSWVEFIEYCQYDRCYIHDYNTACKLNKDSIKTINKWIDRKIPLGIYGYEFDIFKLHTHENIYLPMYSNIQNQLRKLKELNIKLVMPEVPLNNTKGDREASKQNRLGLYIYAQLMWNPDKPLKQLLDQWNKRSFGKLDKYMGQIQQEMMNMWDNADMHLTHYYCDISDTAKKMLTQKTIAKVAALFLIAKTKLASIKDVKERTRIAKNIAWENTLFELWIKARWSTVAPSQNTISLLKIKNKKTRFTKLSEIGGITLTNIGMNWSNTSLNIKAVCKNTVGSIITPGDSIQIRIKNIHDYGCRYREITVNSDGTHKSTVMPILKKILLPWNPKLNVKTTVNTTGWTVELSIPFTKVFCKPQNNENWLFSIRRLFKSKVIASYPVNTNNKLDSFANLYFSAKGEVNKRVLMLTHNQGTIKSSALLREELTKNGWNYKFTHDPKAMLEDLSSYDVVCFYVPKRSSFDKSKIGKVTKELLKKGKVVIFGGYSKLPLDKYLNDPSCKLKGSGWKIKRNEKTKIAPGDWSTKPNNLLKRMKKSQPANWGYAPLHPEKWTILASLKTVDGKGFPCLIVRPYEKGLLVVNGGNMGTGGGWALFGNLHPDATRMLFNNLIEYNKNIHK